MQFVVSELWHFGMDFDELQRTN